MSRNLWEWINHATSSEHTWNRRRWVECSRSWNGFPLVTSGTIPRLLDEMCSSWWLELKKLRKCHAILRMTNHATSLLTCLNMFKIVDFRFRASTSRGFQCEEEWFVWWNGSDSLVKSSLTMVSGWYGFPLFGKCHHCSGVQDSESKQMIEFQADSVHGPMEATFGIKEGISFGSEYSQMLHVSPSQFSAEIRKKIQLWLYVKSNLSLTWLRGQGQRLQQLLELPPMFRSESWYICHTNQWLPLPY